MIIVIDFDETLFPTLQKVIAVYNKRHHAAFTLEQITTYNLHECFEADVADELLELFCDQEVYNNLQPFSGAVKSLKTMINNDHEVYIATATDVRNLSWKEELLQKYFPFIPQRNLIRIHNKKLLKADILIEDNLNNLIEIFADRICFSKPWNINENKDFIYEIKRCSTWSEILEAVNKIEKERLEWEKK